MRAVVQRVKRASVTVQNNVVGNIEHGLLVLLAIHRDDDRSRLEWMAEKLVKLRIFEDDQGKMNRSVIDVGGRILLVSQFTLYGELRKGTRPGFTASAPHDKALAMVDEMEKQLDTYLPDKVETGEFGAHMEVSLVNDGPVTIILER